MQYPASPVAGGHRVVITGAGIVTALGIGWSSNAAGFRAGRTAFRPVSLFDTSRQRVRVAGEVDLPAAIPTGHLPAREATRLDRASRLLLLAADEAWRQSGWNTSSPLPVVLGTTSGGMAQGEAFYRQASLDPPHRCGQAVRVSQYMAHRQGLNLLSALDCEGPITIIANACASGANAIGHAFELVHHGAAERVLAGGYDALSHLVFAGFDSLQALSPTRCRPFDQRRDGLALGEGAAVLALESLDHARHRDAVILGEVAGYGRGTDLHHLTQPNPEGRTALATMRAACACARLPPERIGYLNAHGTGTPLND
ncbi:MAG TPA: beta-ketoacyl-[acyl-carrier-protein] synthase family protein, partial [Methylomirabilota bacterium]|nr:beta-ketoacyl-[acyl-carrier-protein] synthase family protein [Methylomirabilota bacterium]